MVFSLGKYETYFRVDWEFNFYLHLHFTKIVFANTYIPSEYSLKLITICSVML